MSTERFHQKWYFQGVILPLFVTVLGSTIYDAIKEKPLLSTLSSCLNWLWKGLVYIITLKIALYWFLALIVLLVVIIAVAGRSKHVLDPKQQYTTDKFFQLAMGMVL